MANQVVTNGKDVLSWEEMGLDEQGGVIRATLQHVLAQGADLSILLADEMELMRLANWWHKDEYKECMLYEAQYVFIAHNGRARQYKVKWYMNSVDARMYMVTRDTSMTYITGITCDMDGNPIDNIDLTIRHGSQWNRAEGSVMKKDVNYYISLPYREIIETDPAGGYIGYIPDLKGCITQADTKAEIIELLDDAKKVWLEAALEDGLVIPEPLRDEDFSGIKMK